MHPYKDKEKYKIFSNLFLFHVLMREKEVLHAGVRDLHFRIPASGIHFLSGYLLETKDSPVNGRVFCIAHDGLAALHNSGCSFLCRIWKSHGGMEIEWQLCYNVVQENVFYGKERM